MAAKNDRRKTTKPAQPGTPQRRKTDVIKPDKNYDTRPGFDPKFVGVAAPMPKLTKPLQKHAVPIKKKGDDRYELKYYHYSVILNQTRRLAFCAAVNFDGKAKVRYKRTGDDKWFFDPRVPKEAQTTNANYSHKDVDRGHLVRRADAAWGADKSDAKRANDDTFHFTNCSPQHAVFNQAVQATKRNLKLWGNLEEHIADSVARDQQRLSIFNGPVFREDDREHKKIKVPRQFYKVVVCRKDDGTPAAYGFLLSQEALVKSLPTEAVALEAFEAGPFKVFQVPIRQIEEKTKLDFGVLKDYDTKSAQESVAFAAEPVAIERLEQIQL